MELAASFSSAAILSIENIQPLQMRRIEMALHGVHLALESILQLFVACMQPHVSECGELGWISFLAASGRNIRRPLRAEQIAMSLLSLIRASFNNPVTRLAAS